MATLSSGDIVDAYYWARIAYFVPLTVICYDFVLTLGRERQHIWRRGFSRSVLLFYAARYSALSNALFVVLDLTHWPTMSDSLWDFNTISNGSRHCLAHRFWSFLCFEGLRAQRTEALAPDHHHDSSVGKPCHCHRAFSGIPHTEVRI
ncbi:hypothetical protein C8Q78DRAFT_598927 [Trametes maxima]|nr:hypothetical protein C8Q78DRAFT_598927 [Trametes maxima]